jgi:pilus assembly protein Flp/PilA
MQLLGGERMKYLESLKKLQHDESGQDLIEYALIAALLALAAVAGMQGLATAINNEFGKLSGNLT